MNAGLSHTIDSLFGPASQLVDITEFLNSVGPLRNTEQTVGECSAAEGLELECSVSDIRDTLTQTWNDATLSAHLMQGHDRTVSALHGSTPKSKASKSARKTRLPVVETPPIAVQKCIDAVSLKSFRLDAESALFMRASKNSDYNALRSTKRASNINSEEPCKGVVTVSIYDRLAWGQSYVTRSSQHAFLCNQTLQDVYGSIPCVSKHLLADAPTQDQDSGCVIVLEGRAYSNRAGSEDYADKLARHLQSFSTIIKAPTAMEETKISSLSIRVNEPYWLIHAGNCEHFIVVNQIRLLHPSDPHSNYPLTLQMSPALLDLCQACNKVPAVWSIVGDVRLGESPCLMCAFCWDNMGPSHEVILQVRVPNI